MSELSKCPVCGSEATLRVSGIYMSCVDNDCEVCGPNNDPTGEKWNLMCEQIRIGKDVLALVPDDRELSGPPRYGVGDLSTGIGIHFGTRPITPPPTKESVLAECKAQLNRFADRTKIARLCDEAEAMIKQIDAVLERGGK